MPGIALTPVDQNSQLAKIISKLFIHFSLFPKSLIKVDNVYAELCNEVIFFTAGTDKFGGVLLATSGEHASQVYCDPSYFMDELLPGIDVLFTESSLNSIKFKADFKEEPKLKTGFEPLNEMLSNSAGKMSRGDFYNLSAISTAPWVETKAPPIKALIENPGLFAYSPDIGRGLTDEALLESMGEINKLSPEGFMLRAAASAKELELMYPNNVKPIDITVPNPKTFKHYPKDNK